MRRSELPSQFSGNGHNENSDLSPRDRQLFVLKATRAPVPDIDRAKEILQTVKESLGAFGMSSKNRKRLIQGLETGLYGGNAREQASASDNLQDIAQNYSAAKEIFPGNKRVR